MSSVSVPQSSISSLLASLLGQTQPAVQPVAAPKAVTGDSVSISLDASAAFSNSGGNTDAGITINGKRIDLLAVAYTSSGGAISYKAQSGADAYAVAASQSQSAISLQAPGLSFQSQEINTKEQFVINLDANGNPIASGDTIDKPTYVLTVDVSTDFSEQTIITGGSQPALTAGQQAAKDIAALFGESPGKGKSAYEKYRQMLEAQQSQQSTDTLTA